MECNKYVFECIADTKTELQFLKDTGTKTQQQECFRRLIELYSLLNISEGINSSVAKIERVSA